MSSIIKLYGRRRFSTPRQIGEFCQKESHRFEEHHWCEALSSLVELSKKHPRTEVLGSEKKIGAKLILAFQGHFSKYSISHIAWSYGKLGIHDSGILNSCKHQMEKVGFQETTIDDLTKLAWAFSILRDWDQSTLTYIAKKIEIEIQKGSKLREDECFRLRPLSLIGRVVWKKEILGSATTLFVQEALAKGGLFVSGGSKFQEEVTACAIECTPLWNWEKEYQVEGYYLDMACSSRKVAIEADGPQHFYPGSEELIAIDKLRDRLFQEMGWKIIRISYRDWTAASGLQEKKNLLLLKLTQYNLSKVR